jgi:hypothetical protein
MRLSNAVAPFPNHFLSVHAKCQPGEHATGGGYVFSNTFQSDDVVNLKLSLRRGRTEHRGSRADRMGCSDIRRERRRRDESESHRLRHLRLSIDNSKPQQRALDRFVSGPRHLWHRATKGQVLHTGGIQDLTLCSALISIRLWTQQARIRLKPAFFGVAAVLVG